MADDAADKDKRDRNGQCDRFRSPALALRLEAIMFYIPCLVHHAPG